MSRQRNVTLPPNPDFLSQISITSHLPSTRKKPHQNQQKQLLLIEIRMSKYRWNCREGLLKFRLTCACSARADQLHPITPTNTCKGFTTTYEQDQEKVSISQTALQCFSGDVKNINGCHRPDQSLTEQVVDAMEECKNRASVQQHFCPPGFWLLTCNTAGWSLRWVFTGSCHI